MKTIKESILGSTKSGKVKLFVDELKYLQELSLKKGTNKTFGEDAVGNKLEVGDLVYIRTNNEGYYRNTDRTFGIIYNLNDKSDTCIQCYLGIADPSVFKDVEEKLFSGELTKDALLKNQFEYNMDERGEAVKCINLYPFQVFLVKKAKDIKGINSLRNI